MPRPELLRAILDHSIWRGLTMASGLALGCAAATTIPAADHAERGTDAAPAASDRVITMQRFVVSATRIEKNPWRYAALPGFEVLSRASDEATNWLLDAFQRGQLIENEVLPTEWLPQSAVPYLVIIDDTNLATVGTGRLHAQPLEFRSPVDALTWGDLSDRAKVWAGRFEAHDDDAIATNTNVYHVDLSLPANSTISLERLSRCTPALPQWLLAGLLGKDCGIFRQSFMPVMYDGVIRSVKGPGTLWVSLDETQRLLDLLEKDKKSKKDQKMKIPIPPLRELFTETRPADASLPRWESEAGLFVRWGLTGPGHEDPVMSHAFLELVRRARRAPVTEQVFTDCFGFGYAAMEEKLAAFLKVVLAQPNTIDLYIPPSFSEADLKPATADQIGRILGDWLRMQGLALRKKDPGLSGELLFTAGRMLLRAYKNDNGFAPDADAARPAAPPTQPASNAAPGRVVAMEPFIVTAARIRDPGLLAVYGLYEHDTGDDGKAREFLEKAVMTGGVRPRAYIVLAGLRYAEVMAKPEGSQGKLSAAQAASILGPLSTALRSSSASDPINLIVATWEHCEAKPTEADVEKIVEGVARFPRNTRLAYRAALVCAQSGYAAQAAELIEKGLVFATDEKSKADLGHLRATLTIKE